MDMARGPADAREAIMTARVVLAAIAVGVIITGALLGIALVFDLLPETDEALGASVSGNGSDELELTVVDEQGDNLVAVDDEGTVELVIGPLEEGAIYAVDTAGSNYSSSAEYTWNTTGERHETQLYLVDGDIDQGDPITAAEGSAGLRTVTIDDT